MRVALRDLRRGRGAAAALLLASLFALSTAAAQTGSPPPGPPSNNSGDSSKPQPAQRVAKLADYRARARRAFELVEDMARVYEGDFDDEEPEETEDVRDLLPARERVEWGGRFIEVDNTWVHEALEASEADDEEDEKIAAGLRGLAGRLRALEARLGELEGAESAGLDRDAERGRLNSILQRPEFDRERQRQQQQGALGRMVEDFLEWFGSLFPKRAPIAPGASPRVSNATLIVVLLLCLAVLMYVGRLLWRRRRVGAKKKRAPRREARVVLGERLEADQTPDDLLDEAERLARAGELRGAIRKAYVALLCELGDRGVVRLAQHKTNRDYLDAVRRAARPSLYTEMLPLTSEFELHWYGLRPATDADWERFKTRCRTALKEE